MKQRNCTSYVAKTKALTSFAVTAKLICVFVFAYAKSRFSHDEAQILYTDIFVGKMCEALPMQTSSHIFSTKSISVHVFVNTIVTLKILTN